jgi:hypothetical protein
VPLRLAREPAANSTDVAIAVTAIGKSRMANPQAGVRRSIAGDDRSGDEDRECGCRHGIPRRQGAHRPARAIGRGHDTDLMSA